MLKIVVLVFCLLTAARADEMPYWYGTFTFVEKTSKNSTENFKKGDAYYPGVRKIINEQVLSGTITYLPGKRRVSSGTFSLHQLDDRKHNQPYECLKGQSSEYHDYEIREQKVHAGGTHEATGKSLSIYIGDDGSYKINEGFGGLKGPETIYRMREFFRPCIEKPLSRTEHLLSRVGSSSSVTLAAKKNAGTLPPQVLEGEVSVPETDGVSLTFSWKLTRAEPKLVALITGPAVFKRGDLVTLDASSSYGDVTEYSWRFDMGENCVPGLPADPTLEMKGAKISFHALCDFRAHLTIKSALGEGHHITSSHKVQAREGVEWKTKFASKPGPNLTTRLIAEYMHFGVNQCAKHGDAIITHWFHTPSEKSTWLNDGYEGEQLSDNGPFNGMWWVKSQKLEIDRSERVNKNLLTGGELEGLNAQNMRDLQALATQVKAHEAMHSTLVTEALQNLGPDGDAAHQVEAVLGPSEEVLQVFADMKVREVETLLHEATAEANVHSRLRNQSAFNREVSIWVPTGTVTDPGKPFFKNLGPLWSIGE